MLLWERFRPMFVTILREHLVRYVTAPDGRIFHSERGNVVSAPT